MLAIAATALAAGVEGFSAAPTRSFAVRKVSVMFRDSFGGLCDSSEVFWMDGCVITAELM